MVDTIRRFIDAESGGEPMLRGSLCTVAYAVQLQVYGVPDERILAIYPTITREHLRAATTYAADFWGVCLMLPAETAVAG